MALNQYTEWWRECKAGKHEPTKYLKDWHFAAEFPEHQVISRVGCWVSLAALAHLPFMPDQEKHHRASAMLPGPYTISSPAGWGMSGST